MQRKIEPRVSVPVIVPSTRPSSPQRGQNKAAPTADSWGGSSHSASPAAPSSPGPAGRVRPHWGEPSWRQGSGWSLSGGDRLAASLGSARFATSRSLSPSRQRAASPFAAVMPAASSTPPPLGYRSTASRTSPSPPLDELNALEDRAPGSWGEPRWPFDTMQMFAFDEDQVGAAGEPEPNGSEAAARRRAELYAWSNERSLPPLGAWAAGRAAYGSDAPLRRSAKASATGAQSNLPLQPSPPRGRSRERRELLCSIGEEGLSKAPRPPK